MKKYKFYCCDLISLFFLYAFQAHADFTPFTDPKIKNTAEIATPAAVEIDGRTGSIAYSYDIFTPPGTGGLKPSLALRFSSLAKGSPYGWGWNMGYFQSIERSTRNASLCYDSPATTQDTCNNPNVVFPAPDQFELNDALLVRDGNESNRFHKIQNSHAKIIYHLSSNPSLGIEADSWVVTAPDGTQFRFGARFATSRAKIIHPTISQTFKWMLDEIRDASGNIIRIDYQAVDTTSKQIYPTRVHYSYHTTTATAGQGQRVIDFQWGPRHNESTNSANGTITETSAVADHPSTFRSGFGILTTRRLKQVLVTLAGAQVARYEFNYANKPTAAVPQNDPFSKLLDIKRFGRTGSEYFKTSFDYSPSPTGHNPTAVDVDIPYGASGIQYNRDVQINYGSGFRANIGDTDWRLGSAISDYGTNNYYGSNFEKVINRRPEIPGAAVESAMNSDMTGDGIIDRVLMRAEAVNGNFISTIYVMRGQKSNNSSVPFNFAPREIWWQKTLPGQAGLLEHAIAGHHISRTTTTTVGGITTTSTTWPVETGIYMLEEIRKLNYITGYTTQMIDINGDGLIDRVNAAASTVQYNDGTRLKEPVAWVMGPSGSDVNHDYKNFYLQLTIPGKLSNNLADDVSSSDRSFVEMIDVNGDNLPDHVQHYLDPNVNCTPATNSACQQHLTTFLGNGPYLFGWQNKGRVRFNLCKYSLSDGCEPGTNRFSAPVELGNLGQGYNGSARNGSGGGLSLRNRGYMDVNGDGLPDEVQAPLRGGDYDNAFDAVNDPSRFNPYNPRDPYGHLLPSRLRVFFNLGGYINHNRTDSKIESQIPCGNIKRRYQGSLSQYIFPNALQECLFNSGFQATWPGFTSDIYNASGPWEFLEQASSPGNFYPEYLVFDPARQTIAAATVQQVESMMDINGDGVLDRVGVDQRQHYSVTDTSTVQLLVHLGLGDGRFLPTPMNWQLPDNLDIKWNQFKTADSYLFKHTEPDLGGPAQNGEGWHGVGTPSLITTLATNYYSSIELFKGRIRQSDLPVVAGEGAVLRITNVDRAWDPANAYIPQSQRLTHSPVITGFVDINGDGLSDRVIVQDPRASVSAGRALEMDRAYGPTIGKDFQISGQRGWKVHMHPGPGGLLKRVTNEIGGHTDIEYKYNTDVVSECSQFVSWPSPTITCNGADPDLRKNLGSPNALVSVIKVNDGRGQVRTAEHKYAEIKFDFVRKERVGARQHTSLDKETSMVNRELYSQNIATRGQTMHSESVLELAGQTPVVLARSYATNQTTQIQNTDTYATVSSFISSVIYDPDSGSRILKSSRTTYNPIHGNEIVKEDAGLDGVLGNADDIRTTIDYFPNEVNWLISRPAQKRISQNGNLILNSLFFYDGNTSHLSQPTRGLVTQHETLRDTNSSLLTSRPSYLLDAHMSGDNWSVVRQSYDEFGNVSQTWSELDVKNNYSPSRILTYDSYYKTFITDVQGKTGSNINATPITTKFLFDPVFGEVIKTISPDGALSCAEFDGFGRISSVSNSINTVSASNFNTATCSAQPLIEFRYCTTAALTTGNTSGHCDSSTMSASTPGASTAKLQYLETISYNSENADGIRSRKYYDGLGRTYKTGVQRKPSMPFQVNLVRFNEAGQQVCVSENQALDIYNQNLSCESTDLFVTTQLDRFQRPWRSFRRSTELMSETRFGMEDKDGDGTLDQVVTQTTYSSPSPNREVSVAKNPLGKVVWLSEADGSTTRIKYDSLNRPYLIDGPDINSQDQNLMQISYNYAGQRKSIKRPTTIGGTGPQWDYVYDSYGRISEVKSPRGTAFGSRYYYDDIGRLSRRDFAPFSTTSAGNEDIRYTYWGHTAITGKGMVSEVQNRWMTKTFGYDFRGNIVNDRRTLKSYQQGVYQTSEQVFQFLSFFDRFGVLQTTIHPDSETFDFNYDGGKLQSLISQINGVYIDNANYEAHKDRLENYHIRYGDLTIAHEFNGNSQISRISSSRPSQTVMNLGFDLYDRAGNPLDINDNASTSALNLGRSYSYDSLHRMINTNYDGSQPLTLGYDQAGNVTNHSAGSGAETFNYSVNNGLELLTERTVNGIFGYERQRPGQSVARRTYGYDGEGQLIVVNNLELRRTENIWWDADGRMTQFNNGAGIVANYMYDENGQRIRKVVQQNGTIVEDRAFIDPKYWITYIDKAGGAVPFYQKLFEVGGLQAFQTKHSGGGNTVTSSLVPLQ